MHRGPRAPSERATVFTMSSLSVVFFLFVLPFVQQKVFFINQVYRRAAASASCIDVDGARCHYALIWVDCGLPTYPDPVRAARPRLPLSRCRLDSVRARLTSHAYLALFVRFLCSFSHSNRMGPMTSFPLSLLCSAFLDTAVHSCSLLSVTLLKCPGYHPSPTGGKYWHTHPSSHTHTHIHSPRREKGRSKQA